MGIQQTGQIDVVISNQPLVDKINTLQQNISVLSAQKAQLESDLASANSQINLLNSQIQLLNSQISILQNEKSQLQGQLTELQEQVATLETQKTELENQVQSLETQISNLQSQINTLQNNLDTINGEIVENKTEYLSTTKNQIKEAIIQKGVQVEQSDTFRSYANKISQIPQVNTGDLNTLLLMHFDESTTKDDSLYNTQISTGGTPTLSTEIKKFGTASLYLDGSSYLENPDKNFPCMSGYEYTFECFVYPLSLTGKSSYIFCKLTSGATSYGFYLWVRNHNDSDGWFSSNDMPKYSFSVPHGTIQNNKWQHIEIARHLDTVRLFVDGTLAAWSSISTSHGLGGLALADTNFYIGCSQTQIENFVGYIDEIRISNVCRYTENFTPPTEAFTI